MSSIISIEHLPWPVIVACLWKNTHYIGPKGLQSDKAHGFYLKENLNKNTLHQLVGRQKMSTKIDILCGESLYIVLDAENNTVDVSEYDQYHGTGAGLKCVEHAKKWYMHHITKYPTVYRLVNKVANGFYIFDPWVTECPDFVRENQYVEVGFNKNGNANTV
jgi:hypothetical protein